MDVLSFEQPQPYFATRAHDLFLDLRSRTDAYIALVEVIATILEQNIKTFEKITFLLDLLNRT
jgi:hypothetical protein